MKIVNIILAEVSKTVVFLKNGMISIALSAVQLPKSATLSTKQTLALC